MRALVRAALSASFLYDEMRALIASFILQLKESEDGHVQHFLALQDAQSLLSWSWLTADKAVPRPADVDYMDIVERESCVLDCFPPVPRRMPRYSPVIFAHICSGRRRPGDFQEAVEKLGARAISIDILFHVTYGDLCRPQTYELFRRAMKMSYGGS